jgi:hypothetical protein
MCQLQLRLINTQRDERMNRNRNQSHQNSKTAHLESLRICCDILIHIISSHIIMHCIEFNFKSNVDDWCCCCWAMCCSLFLFFVFVTKTPRFFFSFRDYGGDGFSIFVLFLSLTMTKKKKQAVNKSFTIHNSH